MTEHDQPLIRPRAAATALQRRYKRVVGHDRRALNDTWRRLIWLPASVGGGLACSWGGRKLRHVGGPELLGTVAVVSLVGFWWLTMRILLAGRVSWLENE